jgi:hypothetical protein
LGVDRFVSTQDPLVLVCKEKELKEVLDKDLDLEALDG